MLANPRPTSAKPASAAIGCGTASASTMPSAASTPLARNSGAGRTRARTQSPPKRPAAMAPLKLA